MESIFDPPAIVQEHGELKGLAAAINAASAKTEKLGRDTLEQARISGEFLNKAYQLVAKGHWKEWLRNNVKLSFSTVSSQRRIADNWGDVQRCTSVREAMKWMTSGGDEETESQSAPEDNHEHVPQFARKPGQENWCNRCARIGRQSLNCEACAETKKANAASRKPGNRPRRDPIVFDKREMWIGYKRMERNVDALARANGLKDRPTYAAAKVAVRAAEDAIMALQKEAGVK